MATAKKPVNKGGRPRSKFTLGEIKFGKAAKRSKVNMSDRKSVESYCRKLIEELEVDLGGSKNDIRTVLNALRVQIEKETAGKKDVSGSTLRMFEQQQQRFRQVCKDQAAILTMLMKQFELFSSLDKPTSDDPNFTPVVFSVLPPPADIIVANKYDLEAGDIEPDRQSSG